jgi:hypothetical protein
MRLALLYSLGWHIAHKQAWRTGRTGKQGDIQTLCTAADVNDYVAGRPRCLFQGQIYPIVAEIQNFAPN